MSRPLIGITTELGAAAWRDRICEAALSPAAYSRAIERAGAAPVLLPPVLAGAASRIAGGLDGLMFTGGPDVGPRWYGMAPTSAASLPDQVRDEFEIALMRAAIEASVPFLAISRGIQVLNVALGGTLASPPGEAGGLAAAAMDQAQPSAREVRLSPDSDLGRMLGAAATVSVSHHQALDGLGAGLTAVAWADDQVVAVELEGHPFGLGVQWHPEESEDIRIFEELRSVADGSQQRVRAAAR
jgi:putative glutamine amidotransferase